MRGLIATSRSGGAWPWAAGRWHLYSVSLRDWWMRVDPFLVERFMGKYEHQVELNLAETCVKPFRLGEFLRLVGREDYLNELMDLPLTYGHVEGLPELRERIAGLYRDLSPDGVLVTRGAIDANFLAFFSLVEPGDRIVSIFPAYQQLYSLPKAFGAEVRLLHLRESEDWLPDLDRLSRLADGGARLLVVNNPHNPTGALLEESHLRAICDIAGDAGAYVLADESYHGLELGEERVPSMLDVCDRAIVTRSFSKSLSLTGLRLGWIATRDEGVMEELMGHRDYTTISASILLEHLALLAIENIERIYERNRGIVRENLEVVREWVESEPSVDWVPPRAGTVAFPSYSLDLPSEELALRLIREKGVFVVPGCCFEMEGHFRIGFGGDGNELREGLARFSDLLSSIQGAR